MGLEYKMRVAGPNGFRDISMCC